MKEPSPPSLTKIQVVARYNTSRKTEGHRDTAAATATTAATTGDKGVGVLAAVGLSPLLLPFPLAQLLWLLVE